jgi:hypothetical protein
VPPACGASQRELQNEQRVKVDALAHDLLTPIVGIASEKETKMKTSRLLIAFSLISAPPPALAANLEFPVKDIVAACRDRASGIDDADFTSNWIKTCIGNARSSFVSAKIAWKTASLKAKEYCLTTTDPASKGDDFYQLFDFCLATEHMNENKD